MLRCLCINNRFFFISFASIITFAKRRNECFCSKMIHKEGIQILHDHTVQAKEENNTTKLTPNQGEKSQPVQIRKVNHEKKSVSRAEVADFKLMYQKINVYFKIYKSWLAKTLLFDRIPR